METVKVDGALEVETEVVIGHNPEFYALDNRDGAIFSKRWVVIAENDRGDRWVHVSKWIDREDAARLAERVEERGVINLLHWESTDPVYGSQAWEDDQECDIERDVPYLEREVEFEEAAEAECEGPWGWYN